MFKRTPIRFVLLNFAITWGAWLVVILLTQQEGLQPGRPAYVLYGLGGLLGPVVAAVVAMKVGSIQADFRAFLRRLVKVRVPVLWYVAAVAVPVGFAVVPALVSGLFTGEVAVTVKQQLLMILAGLPFFMLGGGLEEVGWRGVLLPELLKTYSLSVSSAILSLLWALWHLPLWFIHGTPQFGSSFLVFVGSIIATNLLLVILYRRTESIFVCVLFHTVSNAVTANVVVATPELWSVAGKMLLSLMLFALWMRMEQSHAHRRSTPTTPLFCPERNHG